MDHVTPSASAATMKKFTSPAAVHAVIIAAILSARLATASPPQTSLPRCTSMPGSVFEGDLITQPEGCCTDKPTICARFDNRYGEKKKTVDF